MKERIYPKFIKYIKETWKNKLFAIFLLLTGLLGLYLDKDGTLFILALIFSIPLFITNKSVFYKDWVE